MNLSIRRANKSDLPPLRDILNHYISETAVTFEMEEVSLENRVQWFEQFTETGPHQLLAAEVDGVVAGFAASIRFHERPAYEPSVMTSVYLDPNHVGKGMGEALYRVLLSELEKTGKVHRAYGLVVLPNPASEKLHKKLDYKEVGLLHEAGFKLGEFHDVRIYERRFA